MTHLYDYDSLDRPSRRKRLLELATVFLKLGTITFGGPAAHIAMIEAEVVTRRSWMTQEKLLELFGLTNLIPGPNSTELAMQIGYDRAGWRGLLIAGFCFILPSMSIVWMLAIGYEKTQTLPQFIGLLYGVKPVIVAIVIEALWKFGRSLLKDWVTGLVGIGAIVAYFLAWDEIGILLGFGILVWLARQQSAAQVWLPISGLIAGHEGEPPIATIATVDVTAKIMAKASDWSHVFLIFLKIGAVLYGSGYVLLAFLQRELVDRNGWITSQQLIDAVAIGQFTPGPVLTTATFIGYLLAGNGGAVAGTIGIFLPSFLLVGILNHWVMPWTRSAEFQSFLSGVMVASLGLMAGVTVTLIRASWIDLWTMGISGLAAIALVKFKVNSAVLLIVGGTIGGAIKMLS